MRMRVVLFALVGAGCGAGCGALLDLPGEPNYVACIEDCGAAGFDSALDEDSGDAHDTTPVRGSTIVKLVPSSAELATLRLPP